MVTPLTLVQAKNKECVECACGTIVSLFIIGGGGAAAAAVGKKEEEVAVMMMTMMVRVMNC